MIGCDYIRKLLHVFMKNPKTDIIVTSVTQLNSLNTILIQQNMMIFGTSNSEHMDNKKNKLEKVHPLHMEIILKSDTKPK